ncbi:hypothetical protein MMC16_005619 [Acarospora aff. strigata]|nr:hypothetical protein [Acarospora aff. strigata]
MACSSSSLTVESYDDRPIGHSSAHSPRGLPLNPRRRHSSYHTLRRHSSDLDADATFLRVDRFLSELERRLEWLEDYRNLQLDAGISRAYATLEAVRDSCSHVSGELIGAGRRRAKVLVETLEGGYNDVLATRESLEAKAYVGIKLMEGILADVEARALAVRDAGLSGVMDKGWRRVDEGLEKAKEVVDEGIGRAKEVVDEGLEKARRAKETLTESIENAVKRAQEHGLIRYDDLPHPWRVNPHIVKGYRFTESKVECIRSAFNVSNELVNIWSHAIGLIIVLSIAFYFYPTSVNFSNSSKTDVFIAAVFFFAACKCLVCSTLWHTMNSIAEQNLMERFACVDYTGISLLIAASIMTTEYTAFYCEPVSRWTYIVCTATLGIGGVILPWHPTFNRADMNWARVAFYVALGATGFAPVIQLNISRGSEWSYYFYAPVMKSVAVYLVGALVYAAQIPERWCPGWFDYIGGSHNIWHLAVLGGILFHYFAMQDFFSGAFQRAQEECALF